MSIKLWCLGFIFSNSLRHIALIKKARSLHIGLWNGIGGTIEDSEQFRDAMSRETKEETGFDISPQEWVRVGDLMGKNWNVALFVYHDTEDKLKKHPIPAILHNQEEIEGWDPDQVAFVPLYYLPFIKAAPHTGTLVYASLEKLKNPNSSAIVIQVI